MTQLGKRIFIDDFRHVGGSYSNFPKLVDSRVVEEWNEPSPDPLVSGKEFVKTEDGLTYWRYDCYAAISPYGYEQLKTDEPMTQ